MVQRISILLTILLLNSCQNSVPDFSGQNAFAYLEKQCSFGPRNPGSAGYLDCLDYLVNELQATADTVWTQPFTYQDPYRGDKYELQNIIARYNPDAGYQVLLGAHWDTRPWADNDPDEGLKKQPILGANDGASGVAVLLEMARIISKEKPNAGITIVFFDGEDLGLPEESNSYAQGSQFFARNLSIKTPDHAIVLDMVGDTHLHLPIERYSYRHAPKLVRQMWQLAKSLQLPAFDQSLGPMIYDDHVPLWEYARIPAVDIIDYSYPHPYANYWHTQEDTPDKCSPKSLAQVGTLLVHHIYGIE